MWPLLSTCTLKIISFIYLVTYLSCVILSPKSLLVSPAFNCCLDHASTSCKQTVFVMVTTSTAVFVHRLLSTIYNQDVHLSFRIWTAYMYVIQWLLSYPWTIISKISIICFTRCRFQIQETHWLPLPPITTIIITIILITYVPIFAMYFPTRLKPHEKSRASEGQNSLTPESSGTDFEKVFFSNS